jgi:prepilin peptidase CpaA
MIQWGLVITLIIIAFFTDIRHRIIPNWLTLTMVPIGIIFHFFTEGFSGLLFSILGLITGFAMLFILYLFGALGAGDVKLFAAIGALAGVEFVMNSLVYAMVYAGLIGLIILIIQKKLAQRSIWLLHSLFSFLVMKEWKFFQSLPRNQMLHFPFMWAVLPAILTYGMNLKGLI